MRSGTTTMKMISSTSTTSTSGVMLISDCKLDSDSPVLNCMMSFSPCAGALCDQSDTTKARIFDREHRLPDFAEVDACVAADHDLGVRFAAYCSAKRVAEMLGCDRLFVDPHLAGLVDRDQDLASLVALVGRFRRVRQIDVRPLSHLRRHHHKDDQQHKHH